MGRSDIGAVADVGACVEAGSLSRACGALGGSGAQGTVEISRRLRDVQKRGFRRGTDGVRTEACAAMEGQIAQMTNPGGALRGLFVAKGLRPHMKCQPSRYSQAVP